jgi:hypothetical protein
MLTALKLAADWLWMKAFPHDDCLSGKAAEFGMQSRARSACKTGHYVQALTSNKIALMEQGRTDTKYRRIACQGTRMHVLSLTNDFMHSQALTFKKIAPMELGRIDIKYRRIACQVPNNMNVIVDANRGAGGWIRLQVKVCGHPD